MVVLSTLKSGRVLKFFTPALPPNTLHITSLQGRERISQPYRFDVELVSPKADVDARAMLQNPALIGIKQGIPIRGGSQRGVQTLKMHGVLSSFEQAERNKDWVRYRASLVPRLARLGITQRTRIFMDKTVPQIVEEVLKESGSSPGDYEFRTGSREYSKREYVAQFQESDLNFVSRLLEHEGIFYYFLQGDDGEKVVFGDSISAHEPILGEATLAYRPPGTTGAAWAAKGGEWLDSETVTNLSCKLNLLPGAVVLNDYNHRTPSVGLKAEASAVATGFGLFYEYGDHYQTASEGKTLAQVRAEEIRCREEQYPGAGTCKSMRAGATFDLSDHYRSDFNRKYLIVDVKHRAEQPVTEGSGTISGSYQNEFVAIPSDIPFRPERRTPKPRIAGLVNARIDAAGDGQYAEIDEEGRYKVSFPFDLSGKGSGTASRWVRMAQPYSGAGMGMHFPLHKGTEVAVAFVNGDPDRPIIVGSVPNAETGSPVKGGNSSQCVIHTGGGNKIVIEDSAGGERVVMSSPHSGGATFRLGAKP